MVFSVSPITNHVLRPESSIVRAGAPVTRWSKYWIGAITTNQAITAMISHSDQTAVSKPSRMGTELVNDRVVLQIPLEVVEVGERAERDDVQPDERAEEHQADERGQEVAPGSARRRGSLGS